MMFKLRFLLGLTTATLMLSLAPVGTVARVGAQVQPLEYHAVLIDGRSVGYLALGQTTLEQAVRMFPSIPPGHEGNPRSPRGFPEAKIGQVSPKPQLVYNPWMTLYLLYFDANHRLVILVDGGKSRFRGLSVQEMLNQYPQLKETHRDSNALEYEMQVEIQPCLTLMILVSASNDTVGDIAFAFTCPAQSWQLTEPADLNERNVFELQESMGLGEILRMAWVDETTILVTASWTAATVAVPNPRGLQVRLIDIATGAVRHVGEGGCASLSPDRSRVAWVRGIGSTPTGDVWILETRSMQARPLAIDAVQEGPRLAGGPVRASCLTWSPDGRKLAITTGGVLSNGPLLIVGVANGQVQNKVESQGFSLDYPAWSPDGQRLVFTAQTVGGGEAARIDAFDFRRGMRSRLVYVPSKYSAENLVYSPDGRDLLFDVLGYVGGMRIFSFDDSSLRSLAAGRSPAWHPGHSLSFTRGKGVYVVPPKSK